MLLRASRRLATDAGWSRASDGFGAPNMMAGLLRLRDRGVWPRSVIDGGACVGDWTRLLRRVFPEARVLMIEPQVRHLEAMTRLAAAHAQHLRFASQLLGPPGLAKTTFCVLDDSSGGTGSSVFEEKSDVPRHVVELPVTTLDALAAAEGFGTPDFIKLDVQGYELEVLRGAAHCLQTAEFVLLETSIRQYNLGSPLLHDVLVWMAANGFHVDEIFDISRDREGVLVQIDLLFRREVWAAATELPTHDGHRASAAASGHLS